MSEFRTLLAAGIFGLALVMPQSSRAEPAGGNPKGAPSAEAPGKPRAPRPPRAADDAKRPKGSSLGRPGGIGNLGKRAEHGKRKSQQHRGPSLLERLQAKKDSGEALTPEETENLKKLWTSRIKREKERTGPEQEAFLALLAKAKDGKLDDKERAELSKLTDLRKRHRWLQRKQAKSDKNRSERARRAKRKLIKRFPGVLGDEKARAELKKHAEREAMLRRMLDLARLEANDTLSARIKKVRAKERDRHDRWMKKHFAQAR